MANNFNHWKVAVALGVSMVGGALLSPMRAQEPEAQKEQVKVRSFKERLAFRTNAVNWLMLMPNIGVEFDVSSSVYSKWTLGAQVTWNGGTGVDLNDRFQMKLNDYRLEARRYFKPSMTRKAGSKRTPKFWRTYYWGIYAGYTEYNLIWKKGRAGDLFQAGVTCGWQVPLYQCRQGGLDLDLGLSVGMIYGKHNRYRYMDDAGMVCTEMNSRKLTPYPVPTELRIGVVYRFQSVKNKYNKTRPTH